MINSKLFLVLTYHLAFAIISMFLVTAIEGYGREMFAYVFYFNCYYLVVGTILDYVAYLGVQRAFQGKMTMVLVAHFLACLLVMNCFSYFMDQSLITVSLFSGIFMQQYDLFVPALVIHVFMLVCYIIAFYITKKKMLVSAQ
jgi:hypothetical protein